MNHPLNRPFTNRSVGATAPWLQVFLSAAIWLSSGPGAYSQERARLIEMDQHSESLSAAPGGHDFAFLIEGGGRLDWSRTRQVIAHDAPDDDGLFDIWLYDVPSAGHRCLTCDIYEFRKAHVLNPTWHPSGDFLVVQVQRHAKKIETTTLDLFGPDRALHSDLWLLRFDGKSFWQLTHNADQGSAVLDPHFSWEGTQLAWSERTRSRKGGRFGSWRVRTAELEFNRGVPKLSHSATRDGPRADALVIVGGWMPNDRSLLVAANWAEGNSQNALDLHRLPLDGGATETLPFSRTGSNSAPHPSPTSDLVAWSSSAGVRARPVGGRLPASEVWITSIEDDRRERLSRFNDPLAVEALGSATTGDLAWSPDGRQIAVQVLYGSRDVHSGIALLTVPQALPDAGGE